MKIRNVIDRNNLPRKLPWQGTLIIILALDYWNAAGWLWGALGLLMLVAWIGYFYNVGAYDEVENDIFKSEVNDSEKPSNPPEKTKWQQRFEDMKNSKK